MNNRFMAATCLLVFFIIGVAIPTNGQVTTGIPPLGSFGGGPDVINLANLNAHLSVPVLKKAGRGMPFDFNLTYDSSVWYPVTSSGTTSWQDMTATTWGWTTSIPRIGQLEPESVSANLYLCPGGLSSYMISYYSNWTYFDGFGTPHPFAGTTEVDTGCGGDGFSTSINSTATDGSGYTVSITGYTLNSLVAADGALINPTGVTLQDKNGNKITENTSGQYYDTLSSTTPVLTVTGSGTPSSPVKFTYAAPSGASAAYTMKYTAFTIRTNFGCSGIVEYGPTSVNLVTEVDLPDIEVNPNDKYTFTYEPTPGYSGDYTGRLASVELPTGGSIAYLYTGSNHGIECSDGSAAGLTRTTPDGQWTYTRTLGTAPASTTIVTDPQGDQTVLHFQGIYETERQVYQGSTSGTLLRTTFTCYNGGTPNCNTTAFSLPITSRSVYVQWPGTGGQESRSTSTFNSFGLLTEKDDYAYGSGSPGSVVRKTLITYASLGNGIENRPATVTVEDGSGNIASKTSYSYDQGAVTTTTGTPQHVSVSGSRGNATAILYYVRGSSTLSRTFSYYDTGNLQVATDVNGAQTSVTYGTGSCGNSFVTSVSEPLSLSKSTVWNCTGGVTTSVIDENGKTITSTYNDPDFWRPSAIKDQLSNAMSMTFNGETSVEGSLIFNSSASTFDVLATLDSLGRTHLTQKREAPGSGSYDSIETDYDSLGRASRTSLPYSGSAGQTNSSAPGTVTTYDALGRTTNTTDSGGGYFQYFYSQDDIMKEHGPAPTGENTKTRQFEYDSLDRLVSVCEVTSLPGAGSCGQHGYAENGYLTTYSYNPLGKLTGVSQNSQGGSSSRQSRSYAYDLLGRLISETNPESATTTYTYDTDTACGTSNGDLVKKTDAVGNVTCYTYDALHRVTHTLVHSGSYASSTPDKYFVYDAATVNGVAMTNVKRRLAEAYTCVSPCTSKITDTGLSYTARGEASDMYESTPHSGGYNHVAATYWANHALNQISGLSGLPTITYNVDGEGRIYSAAASSGQNPLSSTNYNVAGLPTQVNLGSLDSDTFAYDPNSERMTNYQFNMNGQSIVGQLTWNAIGTLASLVVTDPFYSMGNQSCTYSHDDLARIASANCGSAWSQLFTYDAFGNLNKNGTVSFQPVYSYITNQMTQIGSSTPLYDANGNVTDDFLHTYAWDANGRPVTIDGVGATYDALGRMVEINKNGTYSEIVYAPSGAKLAIMNGSSLQKAFVPLAGGAVAVYGSSGLAYYRHPDWVGSSRFASTPSRTLYYDGAYAPFGEPYAQTGTTDLSFTGMNQDTSPNAYDFPSREYGTQGRWPSPDPAGLGSVDPRDPQTLNRYAYVRNSPLRLTDPNGMEADCTEDTPDDNSDSCCPESSDCIVGGGGGGDGNSGGGGGDNQDPQGGFCFDSSGNAVSCGTDANPNPDATCWNATNAPCGNAGQLSEWSYTILIDAGTGSDAGVTASEIGTAPAFVTAIVVTAGPDVVAVVSSPVVTYQSTQFIISFANAATSGPSALPADFTSPGGWLGWAAGSLAWWESD